MSDLNEEYRVASTAKSDMRPYMGLLTEIVIETNARSVIELGVRSGRSTLAFLYALQTTGGALWSCDIRPPLVPPAVREAPNWTFALGDDLALAPLAPSPADILFIDTSHSYDHTLAELSAYVPLVRVGGVVLAHDTILFGDDVARALDNYFSPARWKEHGGHYGMGEVRL